MSQWWSGLGRLAFWLCWPVSFVYLRSHKRARILVACGNHLVVTRSWLGNGQWALPGGGLRKGEGSLDAVLRELYEETGLRLQPTELRRHSEQIFRGSGLQFNYVLFVAVLKRKAPLHPRPLEITAAQWLPHQAVSPGSARLDVLAAIDVHWPAATKTAKRGLRRR